MQPILGRTWLEWIRLSRIFRTTLIYIFYFFVIYTSKAARGGGGSFKIRKRIGEIGCCESRMTKQKH